MVQGINTAASGMISVLNQNDIIANNLANVNTAGFKQLIPTFQNIHESIVYAKNENIELDQESKSIGTLSNGCTLSATQFDFTQGALKQTGRSLDIALSGEGFFAVKKDSGEYYTRNGSLSINENGELTTSAGDLLLGEGGGAISIDTTQGSVNDIIIAPDGRILQKDVEIDRLKIVNFEDKSKLIAMGDSLFKNNGNEKPVEVENLSVSQGYIETSNANVVESMINSITGARTYETLAKVIRDTDQTVKLAATQVGTLN